MILLLQIVINMGVELPDFLMVVELLRIPQSLILLRLSMEVKLEGIPTTVLQVLMVGMAGQRLGIEMVELIVLSLL